MRALLDTSRLQRRAAVILAATLATGTLVACGSDGSDGDAGLAAVQISGDFGEAPEVEFDGRLEVTSVDIQVVHQGDGPLLATGDRAFVDLWIGNGFTGEEAYSSFDEFGEPEMLTVDDQISEGILAAMEGHPTGSRVAVAAPPASAFGEMGNPGLGIGNADSVVFIVDILSKVLTAPEGDEAEAPAGTPAILDDEGRPTGFDFDAAAEPGNRLQVHTLVEGSGPVVEEGQLVAVNYLGQVFGGEEPFDQSYARGEPSSFPIGVGQVIEGWDRAVVGATVGSRLIVVIPPRLGYGEDGNEGAGITGTDTLVFIIDILGAA
ncbi:FKBP-type peptidyl-prolyl cis-trans isomerase [Nocardioides limicola]|uniref:FKBP-type peptidyl-prolyl cis-trans isomerase n=1 Tax=Nocardioides limicola TaxID=2803368 RepID=UPI00193B19B5|nr:FKBP-type peptidyl-prolyl cis-trans isomerase [Nocardioides sp. DJM-14]